VDVALTDDSFNYLFVGSVPVSPYRQRKSGIHSADDAAIIGSFDPAYIRRPVRFAASTAHHPAKIDFRARSESPSKNESESFSQSRKLTEF
jgi:hypothetical protein